LVLILSACVGGLVAGNLISLGVESQRLFAAGFGSDFKPANVGIGVAPFVALLVIGVMLI